MLYLIADQLGFPGVLNLIRYISFRAGAASATALLIGLLLGPMRELGAHSDELHAGLAPAILSAHVDRLILIGEEMRPLDEALDGSASHSDRVSGPAPYTRSTALARMGSTSAR